MTGIEIVKRNEALESQRSKWVSFWQELGRHVQIRKSEINSKRIGGPDLSTPSFLYDSTATRANMTLAQGQVSLVSPADEVWFEFDPPLALRNDEGAISLFREMSAIVREFLGNSNFYTEVHEMYLQRGGFGTSALYSAIDGGELFFKSYDIGTYCICEDHRGRVDTFFRRYSLSARQAAKQFGEDRLPEKIRVYANDPQRCEETFEFIHAAFPRETIPANASEAERKPIASYHVSIQDNTIVKSSGYDSFPFHVSRYLGWSDEVTDPYGWCPGWSALPDIRQVNLLGQYLDVLAENAAFPRVLAPASLEGEIDLRALGITYFDPITDRATPTEWATSGRYDIGQDRLNYRVKAIEEAYHVDLFLMFSKLEKQAQMSVREVVERSSEKLLQFSPTFGRLVHEVLSPVIRRVTGLVAELGGFNHLSFPDSVRMPTGDVADPNIRYTSRIALALQSLQNAAMIQTLEAVTPVAQYDPTVLDVLNFEKMVRGFARNTGLPEPWLNTPAEVQAIQERRQQLMEAQQEAEIAAMNAKALPQ